MTETPEDHPRPAPRPRTGPSGRPSPRARVAGARRDRDEPGVGTQPTARRTGAPASEPASTPSSAPVDAAEAGTPLAGAPTPPVAEEWQPAQRGRRERPRSVEPAQPGPASSGTGLVVLVAVLAVLCLLAAVGTGLLFWQRQQHPSSVDPKLFTAARSEVQALYAFDYKDADGSIARKLDVLTGSLRDDYKKDLKGAIIDTYKQVSATTSYDVVDVGLQQINDAQDAATVVVFGQYVVKSVNTANKKAPPGSECQETPDGGQSCTQTVKVDLVKVKGVWKIKGVTLITSS